MRLGNASAPASATRLETMNTELHVTYHAFGLIEDDLDWPEETPPSGNGLVHPFPGGALISTGIHTGMVNVETRACRVPPTHLDEGQLWQVIVEVSVTATLGRLRLRSYDADPEADTLSMSCAGAYRVRAYALGRDSDPDGTAPLVESHLLEVWPSSEQEAVVYRSDDRYGQQVLEQMDAAAVSEMPPGAHLDGTVNEWV